MKSTSIEIKLISTEHCAQATQLSYRSHREMDEEPLSPVLKKLFASFFKKDVDGKNRICWVALSNGKVVGYLRGKLSHRVPGEPLSRAFLEDVYLIPRYRSSGVGKKLFHLFQAWAKEKKMKRIVLNADKHAVHFWEKMGFKETHRVMRKLI